MNDRECERFAALVIDAGRRDLEILEESDICIPEKRDFIGADLFAGNIKSNSGPKAQISDE
jgi:hypothetical protein